MCGCITYTIAYLLATIFLMMLTGLGPTPALIITAALVVAGGWLRLRYGLYNDTPQPRQSQHTRVNFRDIQANRRIARGQNGIFDHYRQNRMAHRIWKKRK
jgi:hypothetical protein